MSNQLQITGGAKVRNLEGVLTGTSGVVSSLGINVPSGIPQLDGSGKILVSQLPNSVMEYKGTWDASTNTPTLVDGTGNAGDVYLCNVAGTVNFGSGPITFYVGDQVLYSGTIWQRASGASGSVTSVAVTESGDALTITGSPITTSGTINIGFAGTGSQYIKGDGTLATFPTTIDQAKRLITEVYNSTGATLSKGTVVYINGGQGNLPTVTKAQANADNTSAQTYGVVQSDITNNNNGFVVVIGSLTDIDTQAYAVGTQLYLSGTTAGDWTSTKPSAPIHLVYVGIVVRSHPTQGVVEIRIQNGYELEELHDVAISALVNNQGIFYNSSTDLWENKSIATVLGYTPANDALVVHLAGTETITGVKNFDIGLTLRDGYYPTPANGYIGLASNGSGLTILTKPSATVYNHNLQFQASSNDYNFPAITGVMAMLEGTQTFSGNKTFSALTAFTFLNGTRMDYGLYLSKGSVPSAFSGSTVNLYSDSGNNNLVVRDNSNTSLLQFQAASSYTYTFPAASGSLALLESTQTFTGDKTFSGDILATNYYRVQQNATLGVAPSGYSTFGAINTKLNFGVGVAVSTQKVFQFETSGLTNNTTRVYTLPDASGTLALTSNLSSYVPYTGATTNVDLGSYFLKARTFYSEGSGGGGSYAIKNGTTPSFEDGYTILSSNDYRLNIVSTVSASTKAVYFGFSGVTATRTYTLPDATGTIALTSNLSSYLPLTGGTLTGALNGTSATFSSSVTANGVMSLSDDGTYGSNYKTLGFTGNTNGNHRIFAGVTDGMFICSKTGEGIFFRVNGGTTNNLTISSAGNVGIGTSSPSEQLNLMGANAYTSKIRFSYGASSTGYYTNFGYNSDGNKAYLQIADGGSPATIMTWNYNGNVGIGTTNPTRQLFVNSTAFFDNNGDGSTTNPSIAIGSTSVGLSYIGGGNLALLTGGTERIRITSGGQIFIGKTADAMNTPGIVLNPSGTAVYSFAINNNEAFILNNANSSTNYKMDFRTNSISRGNINVTDTATTYNTGSDYRLKKDLKDYNGLNIVSKIKTYDFAWNIDDSRMHGVIAHELSEVLPYAVQGEKDAESMQSVDYSKLVPVLVKAIQELNQELTELKAKLA